MAQTTTILIVDDQPDILEALRLLLRSEGYATLSANGPGAALELAASQRFACAIIDLNYTRDTTSGDEGMALLVELQARWPDMPVVVMTAWGNVALAVEAMRAGAGDFIEKPWENQRLVSIVRAQTRLAEGAYRERRLEATNALLSESPQERLVAESASMRRLLEVVSRIAPSDANVLVLGENGTGKNVIAQRIHELSRRASHPFIKVNMGGIAETTFESELFGHVRGAFTDAKVDRIGRFELADGGTLFLDEVGNVPASQQPKLLRVLEDGEFERLGSSRTQRVNARLVSATNADLVKDVGEGRFRRDLMYRLNTIELVVPPLRQRPEDIVPLARQSLARSAQRYGREGLSLTNSAERALVGYSWPGNIRELGHLMERAVLLAEGDAVGPEALSLNFDDKPPGGQSAPLDGTLEAVERRSIERALSESGDSLAQAAQMLGISRQTLYRKLEKHGLKAADDT